MVHKNNKTLVQKRHCHGGYSMRVGRKWKGYLGVKNIKLFYLYLYNDSIKGPRNNVYKRERERLKE
jgi:hypothetical protein